MSAQLEVRNTIANGLSELNRFIKEDYADAPLLIPGAVIALAAERYISQDQLRLREKVGGTPTPDRALWIAEDMEGAKLILTTGASRLDMPVRRTDGSIDPNYHFSTLSLCRDGKIVVRAITGEKAEYEGELGNPDTLLYYTRRSLGVLAEAVKYE